MSNTQSVSFLKHDDTVTIVYDGNVRTYDRTSPQYDTVIEMLKTDRLNEIPDYLDSFKKSIEAQYEGFVVEDDVVYVEGKPLPNAIGKKLREYADEGLPYKHVLNFWMRLQKNVSNRVVNQLFTFLEKHAMPLYSSGHLMAWKSVRGNWTDWHTGTVDNSIGKVVVYERNNVEDDPQIACGQGGHSGSFSYASNFHRGEGGHLIEVKIDPADVVSIPYDCDASKMRVCKYEVIRECDWDQPRCTLDASHEDDDFEDDYEDDEYYDDDDDCCYDEDEDDEDDWGM